MDGFGAALDVVLDALYGSAKLPRIGRVPGCSVGDVEYLVYILFNACVWVKERIDLREEIGWIGGLPLVR